MFIQGCQVHETQAQKRQVTGFIQGKGLLPSLLARSTVGQENCRHEPEEWSEFMSHGFELNREANSQGEFERG